ncbi:RDD family protein [Knoellia sp. CPCC 206450]|uniref:RDD family protein n=1 Tax=Knoellia tibetensis TaxID=3404798 RepID=UPI003B43B40B
MSTPSGPGWYENPDNPDELRYFDGILWTSHTTPLRTRRAQPPAAQPTPPQAQPGQQPSGAPAPHQQGQQPQPGQWEHQGPGPGQQYPGPHPQQPRPSQAVLTDVPGQPVLAPYGLRVVAYLVDAIIVSFVALIVGGWFLWKAIEPIVDRVDTAMTSGDVQAVSAALGEARLGYLALFLGIQLVLMLAYHVACLVRWGATPGKLLVGISVRRLDRPGPLDADTAIRRTGFQAVAQALGNVPYLSLFGTVVVVMDLVWPIADARRQALHDKVAKTIVVRGRAQR